MKKLLALVAVLFASATLAHAQFGILAGINFSNTNLSATEMWEQAKTVTLFHVGATYKINMGMGFAIQPALTYEMKGASIEDSKNVAAFTGALDSKSGFLELGVGLQWGPDLFIGRPFVMVQPFVGYMVAPSGDKTSSTFNILGVSATTSSSQLDADLEKAKNKLEYGFSIGAGIELIKHLQLSVQYFMNLGKLYNDGKVDGTQVWDSVKNNFNDINNYNGVKVTLGYLF